MTHNHNLVEKLGKYLMLQAVYNDLGIMTLGKVCWTQLSQHVFKDCKTGS